MTNDEGSGDAQMTDDERRKNGDVHMTNEGSVQEGNKYDLEERTARFGEAIIGFAKKVPQNVVSLPLINQLVRARTSIGANYCAADDAVSKKEFRCKIGTCKKEARETKCWLRMVAAAEAGVKADARPLWQEAKELHLIFAAIYRK